MHGGVDHLELAIADANMVAIGQAPVDTLYVRVECENFGVERTNNCREHGGMIGMAMGNHHLIDLPLAQAGVNPINHIHNRLIVAHVHQGGYIVKGIPGAKDQVGIRGVNRAILGEVVNSHRP